MMAAAEDVSTLNLEEVKTGLLKMPESLFDIKMEVWKTFPKRDLKEKSGEDAVNRNTFSFEIAAHLILGETEGLLAGISADLDLVPDNIHAWCNKAMYHALKGEREESVKALAKAMELQKQPLPYSWSKMSYSYWMAEQDRSDDAREKAYVVFEEVLAQAKALGEDWLKLYSTTSFKFLQVMVRHLKDKQRDEDDRDWRRKKMARIFDMLINIHDSSEPNREQKIWLWLSEIHSFSHKPPLIGILGTELQRFKDHTGYDTVEFSACVEKVLEQMQMGKVNRNLLARIGKNCLYYAYWLGGGHKEYEKFCDLAIKLCEQLLMEGERGYMAYTTAAKARMSLFASHLYRLSKCEVDADYQACFNFPPDTQKRAIKFVQSGSCFVTTENPGAIYHAEKAHEHLEQQQETYGTVCEHTYLLARVKYILQKPFDEVEEMSNTLTTPEYEHDRLSDLVNTYTCFGRFYEKYGMIQKAENCYQKAVRLVEGTYYWPVVAQNRLRAIRSN